MPLDDAHVLDHHGVLLRVDRKHAPAFAGVFPGNHPDVIALANLNRMPLGSFVSQCHGLPDLRSQRNYLRKFLLAQFTRHRAERSEEHTSELQSRGHLVCRLLLETKKDNTARLTV